MKKILLVEDNEENIYLITFILEKNNYEVFIARDGKTGIELTKSEKPDAILMDVQLPDINGLEVTKIIRASESKGTVSIIAITSYAMVGDKDKALEAGCNGYIEKPINPEMFMDELKKYL